MTQIAEKEWDEGWASAQNIHRHSTVEELTADIDMLTDARLETNHGKGFLSYLVELRKTRINQQKEPEALIAARKENS